MKAENFCYWLQGYLELTSAGDKDYELTDEQVKMIQRHLALVFQHDIDPKTEPDPKKAQELQKLHDPTSTSVRPHVIDPNVVYRC
jgi:hypothetical protein